MADLNNKWIFGGVDSVINVSEKENGEIVSELKKRGVEYHHFPLKEEVPNIGWGNIQKAVAVILKNIDRDKSMVVHCIGGNHRSPLVVEAAYYSKFHKHIEDEYKGCRNHLIYNCENCFLPLTLREIETELELVGK